jgi:hypothetical protein
MVVIEKFDAAGNPRQKAAFAKFYIAAVLGVRHQMT